MTSRVLAALRDWFVGVGRGGASSCSGDPIAAQNRAEQVYKERLAERAAQGSGDSPGGTPSSASSARTRGAFRGPIALLVAVLALGGVASAQRFFFSGEGRDPEARNQPYDGRFTFARLKYTTAPGGYWYQGLPSWAHGYPMSEDNLLRIMNEVTYLNGRTDSYNLFSLDDDELCKYPIAYLTEAGWWTLTDKEAEAFRKYIQKGGFVIFDDFKVPNDYGPGGGGWDLFEENMKRVIPGARWVPMTPEHPIFHSFFEINTLDDFPQAYNAGRPIFRGLYEDNDPKKRLQIIVNYNTDISQYWEWSGRGLRPFDETNEAYKLGVNYVIYGLTH